MRQSQKLIKSIAFSVALLLVIMIFSGIVMCGYSVLKAVGVIDVGVVSLGSYKEKEIDSLVSSLNIDLVNSNVYIKKGDVFRIECNSDDIEINNNNGYINIKDTSLNIFNNTDKDIVIYLDRDIDFLGLETTNGEVSIDSLVTNTLDLDLGIGKVLINEVEVMKELVLDSGVGKTMFVNSVVNNIDADLGIGDFSFSGEILGESKIDIGLGNSELLLIGGTDDYTIKVNKGLGKVVINKEEINNEFIYGNGLNSISIDGGLGNISISFMS